ncbi:Asp-tRNA(Asn)/Glu-tRNA(Gln) amidotransferase subunit GatB [Legionella micdadei]|uniref:Aspartyl/glutamyl-tRNA(Asn/Gln) amidotransferase subunit B n=1 Tax=Legionella micdadei TaxID=451 RepID=A0A098GFE9_LEGMI|nr:Asp-tRNA(Asn)/Glu-tRNA(Gln) amidotransferase subunit GatB [Legionella micdadei]ARG97316.1 aspartyl/glutamyl-tRNA amidotransferase subunit B [Legionella micdadei]KTD28199.1 aspartyl/glutamyl-tRNA amidotransferase subunit B [Legionella micdadei]NSL16828.1 Asp-tRNA(Asn)/Glu-tRNA(Gln) amidotransferase subunit GatB [Legionella micdadei]CEG61214.1 Aspartyl/glutamyl-tRNA(Asn/Gln) amidotransferase subunit B [Legionella micdadei]SCY33070.1 aspartyl/glutamyl-tRNA(Asn/Gln) amidotransferase subunit B [
MAWDTVIGLEVHAQLKTKSKLFSGAATTFGAAPNTQTSFIDAGLPGVLPVLNQQAVFMAVQFGLAINAQINDHSYFERKNYFYPDLPKGYQISQFQRPIVSHGHLIIEVDGREKQVEIMRAHLEEDAGKSLHDAHPQYTGVDLNRAGTPLLEIVTAPCLYSAEEAISYLRALHRLVQFLGICDGNMQEGSFRCDVNISLKPQGSDHLGTRTELKNLNSFRFIEKAIRFEQARHLDLLECGQPVQQETRLYCPNTNTTQVLRSKENENDYRYFPDPDLLPIQIHPEDIEKIRKTMPSLPQELRQKLKMNQNLHDEDINFLLSSPAAYQFFSEVKQLSKADEKMIANWLRGSFAAALNDANLGFEHSPLSAAKFAPLLSLLAEQKISVKIAKQIFTKLWAGEGTVEDILHKEGYGQIHDDDLLESIVRAVINQHPQQVADFQAGKDKLLGFFMGQVMKQTGGQAAPEQIHSLLKKYLNNSQ